MFQQFPDLVNQSVLWRLEPTTRVELVNPLDGAEPVIVEALIPAPHVLLLVACLQNVGRFAALGTLHSSPSFRM